MRLKKKENRISSNFRVFLNLYFSKEAFLGSIWLTPSKVFYIEGVNSLGKASFQLRKEAL
ncbi:hypothetical protein J2Z81_001235 [Virgibacillus campisalis]|uniref:Uncharacterized protein n=1 Tax=Virgibacillus alimentarius TaxID=698769 RepID=A0ABS4SA74_9BACI|nr:hypothetical protein [Virgibacillus alimentarius]